MSSSVIEQDGKITIPQNIIEKLGVARGDEVEIEIVGSNLLIRLKKNSYNSIISLKGCIQDNKTDPLTLKSIWKM
ncbi:AbrB/MazE/SpoVT family DNA-binding domain-containing protein [Methanospirillum stamsii]|uniref:AbrB/MazE/SpoVT family DNA-binding domain-containing protein n=1 Tax=Methanospirillum stamsii TaxID=1277351 RepID=A0A2V2MVU4_9EURY|nr:AbrB/MazE/SpoVT family DNA-binding domain-containing protein [Methanospirillum stamsii]PWR69506.1 AbrB/MazE/SpoVT family DNA-binding domain-containing protein [Methanospirillum stamsii]